MKVFIITNKEKDGNGGLSSACGTGPILAFTEKIYATVFKRDNDFETWYTVEREVSPFDANYEVVQ